MVTFKSLDFSPLQDIDLNYASQASIPANKSDMFLVFVIHYNFDLPSVIRYMGENYTAASQDVEDIAGTLTSAGFDESVVNKIKRIVVIGRSFGTVLKVPRRSLGCRIFEMYSHHRHYSPCHDMNSIFIIISGK